MPPHEQDLNRILNAIADPTRRRILQALKEHASGADSKHGLCASDIEQRIQLSQPTISHHMAVLTKAGLVDTKKIGLWRWYRRNETALRSFTRILKKNL
jgi:DNA-binding transcriptional ArsR family regulator